MIWGTTSTQVEPGFMRRLDVSLRFKFLVREISRFLVGNTGIESSNSRAWKHSRQAFEILEDRCYVGELYEPSRDQEWNMRLSGSSTAGFSNELWTLVGSERISNTTNRYELKNPKFYFRLDLPSTEWMGRHFIVSKRPGAKSRLYTSCLSLDKQMVQYRDFLVRDSLAKL